MSLNINIHDIASRVKLVTFKTGKPGFTKLNKKETDEMRLRHGTDAGRAIVTHCDHPTLGAVENVHGDARMYHRGITQPSVTDGLRIVPDGVELDHAAKMNTFKAEANRLAHEFLTDYPQLMMDAPVRLNGLYDARAWKPVEIVRAKFVFELDYLPCPTNGRWADWLSASVAAAQQELTERLEECIKRVAERCASDGPLYESVFGNLKEVLDLVPHLNLANDPKIAAIAQQAKLLLKDRDRLADKHHKAERRATAVEADRLAGMFGFQASRAAA